MQRFGDKGGNFRRNLTALEGGTGAKCACDYYWLLIIFRHFKSSRINLILGGRYIKAIYVKHDLDFTGRGAKVSLSYHLMSINGIIIKRD